MSNITDFKKISNLEFELVENEGYEVMAQKYLKALEQGKKEGFTPVYVILDDILLEKFELDLEDYSKDTLQELTEMYLSKASEINVQDFFSPIDSDKLMEDFEDDFDLPSEGDNLEIISFPEEDDDNRQIILVKVPTNKPYEVLSYLPMGGFNDCPEPDVQTAISKYWFKKYKAYPVAISYDEVEYYVEKPPKEIEEAKRLALEHYIYCVDIVEQNVGSIDKLLECIYKNCQWYFWWD